MRPFVRRGSASVKGMVTLGLLFLAIISLTSAQSVQSTAPAGSIGSSSVSSQLQSFQAEQQALGGELETLLAQGATLDQLSAWAQQNAARIAAQQQRALALSTSQPPQPMAYVTDVDIPAGASQTMEDFLTAGATLFNLYVQRHNQQLQSAGTVNEGQVTTVFVQQNAAALQAQSQRAQVLAQESDQQPLPVPDALVLPAATSPAERVFLVLQDELFRERIAVHNQNLSLSYAARAAVLLAWDQANASRFQQLQTDLQNMTTASN